MATSPTPPETTATTEPLHEKAGPGSTDPGPAPAKGKRDDSGALELHQLPERVRPGGADVASDLHAVTEDDEGRDRGSFGSERIAPEGLGCVGRWFIKGLGANFSEPWLGRKLADAL